MMRILFGAAVLLAAVVTAAAGQSANRAPTSGPAAPMWPWCAEYDMDGAVVNCGFASREQCMATVSGIGGGCRPNLAVEAPVAPKRAAPSVRSYAR
ncbi:DUF3551 domain-containing protein [Rhodoplanes roseus]|uniref:DUF3551 domain-containing protein n=1 Tax=Rhodoplanes roseus TaxID=29409 RepID=A0A327L206_9BRAD|nr:DUF3551 domain-containing protein [Rhodoplanes roseus]RAI44015.1 hypothetical protein CH341_11335 [Rhodoplanes roseus]